MDQIQALGDMATDGGVVSMLLSFIPGISQFDCNAFYMNQMLYLNLAPPP